MIKTTAIDYMYTGEFSAVWDTGRRCNYDCTYCEATRHNNFSEHKSLTELLKTYEFIKQYADLYNQYRKHPVPTQINFTGGEPTANLNFWKLIEHIKTETPDFKLGLTTNGAWNKKFLPKVLKYINWSTVSYHTEAADSLKKQALDNIFMLHDAKASVNVNLMLHMDHWDECMGVYDQLIERGIRVSPRPIGDGAITVKGWFMDTDGSMRRTSHEYTAEQQAWFFEQRGIKAQTTSSSQGTEMGRACCGGICLKGKVDGEWQEIKLIDTHFKDWNCMVNWFFLYVDQETGKVSHHQTCRALFDKTRGYIGTLDDTDSILNFAKDNIDNTVVCPNPRCGCGMCVPKAQSAEDFKIIRQSIVK
jgi:MoaA/NifB/PqqE/SkfB family radical SAM enzyme